MYFVFLQTIGDVGVLGLISAKSVCRKIKVITTVRAMFSLHSEFGEINVDAIPVDVTSSIGRIKL